MSPDSYGGLLSSVLINKLPHEIQLLITRKFEGDDWDLEVMMELVEGEVKARERTVATQAITRKPPNRDHPTAAALFSGGSHNLSGKGSTCSYCQQTHTSNSCGVVVQPEARRRILQRSGRCYVCLRRGHIGRECSSGMKCQKCGGRHHVSICFKLHGSASQREEPSINSTTSTSSAASSSTQAQSALNPEAPTFSAVSAAPPTTSMWVDSGKSILLQTAQAQVFNPEDPQRSLRVRIVLDSGSQRSYVTEKVRERLVLSSAGEQTLQIVTFGSQERQPQLCKLVRLGIVLKGGYTKCLPLLSVPSICKPLTSQPVTLCQQSFEHLAGLDLADPVDESSSLVVDVLVGCDLYWELTTGHIRRGSSGPVAIQTKLGWVLAGPVVGPPQLRSSTCLVTHTLRVDSLSSEDAQFLDNRLKDFWSLESFGVNVAAGDSILNDFRDKIRFVDGRYEVSLPWKDSNQELPDNYELCRRRLRNLVRRLQRDPETMKEYDAIIRNQIELGIVEPVNKLQCTQERIGRIHYLPHHAVIRHDKDTTKVRVVYDASARSNGPSLNDCLHAGPKFDQTIFDLLLKFRAQRVALMADIEKAFLMVSVAKEDREVLRFLWVKDVTAEDPEPVELRFTRVVFGVSSSPFLLNATIRCHLENASAESSVIEKLIKSFYVDDLITGAHDEEEAFKLYQCAKEVLKSGGFNLRKFISNSTALQARIDATEMTNDSLLRSNHIATETDETYVDSNLCPGQEIHPGGKKVLGVCWDVVSDHLVMSLQDLASVAIDLEPSKRNIVSLVGRFYDPLGFLAPIVVCFKMFLQELCGARLGWDEPLPSDLLRKWNTLKLTLLEGQSVSIPRYYCNQLSEVFSATLCGFCDASLKAYAAVVYLLLEMESGVVVQFVASKTRVSPLKSQTIPRLELLSALLLARLLNSVTQSLGTEFVLSLPQCFTDSTVALCWIKGTDKTWKPFVQNRVSEIRSLVSPSRWKHCSGKENPADIPSRGLSPLELSVNPLWCNGPKWLGTSSIPNDEPETFPPECIKELKSDDSNSGHVLLSVENEVSVSQIIRCEEFSSFHRLMSVTALVLKFCRILHNKVHPNELEVFVEDEFKAEELWIIEAQKCLVSHKNFKLWRIQFDLFQDDKGIWRCRGRLQNAAISYTTKHPAMLTSCHWLTTLIVWRAHGRVMHNGVKETLTDIRSSYWIVKGRSFVRKLLRQCVVCRRYSGRPYGTPLPPPLPVFRVEEGPPFSFTGIDFAGPLYIKSDAGTRKVWICLYTCCVVRAVHLDLVPDLSTAAFLRSLKRFIARRGIPVRILSDNGKTFKAAAEMISTIFGHVDVQRYLTGLRVKWTFNVPKAPWWGGVFERMIQSTKRCLRKIIGRSQLTYDELLTALTEIELVINCRPLSYVSEDDLEEPLTPSHLLVGRRLLSLPDHICSEPDEFEATPEILSRRVRHLNHALNSFWKRWRQEYLTELRESHRHHRGTPNPVEVSVGDVVVIHSDNQPRGFWKLGKIEETLSGPDEIPRAALVKVMGKGKHATHLRRPIQKLYPLEVLKGTRAALHPEEILSSKNLSEDPSDEGRRNTSAGCSETARAQECNLNEDTERQMTDIDHDFDDANEEISQVPPTRTQRPKRSTAVTARDRLKAIAVDSSYD